MGDGERDWGITAASLRSPTTRDALSPQDGLYTLAMRDGGGTAIRVIGSIQRILVAPESPAQLLDALADPAIKLVTLTITEKGYLTNIASQSLCRNHPDIVHDIQAPGTPRTALGFLTGAIARRRAAGSRPFTVLSCDNLPNNGRTLRSALAEFARLRDPDLGTWIEDNVSFPSSMVDRIVPATTEPDRIMVEKAIGATDAWPVVCEPFLQWVIQDDFIAGRPSFERWGAEFVSDVSLYEHMKLRLLNGAHTVLAAIGRLAGFVNVSDATEDPSVRSFIAIYWDQVGPTVNATIDVAAYTTRLLMRFSNTALPHKTAQIAMDASLKIPQRILAPLTELRSSRAPSGALVLAVAAWIRSCGAIDDDKRPFEVSDPQYNQWADAPDQRAASPSEVIHAFLKLKSVFGVALPQDQAFVSELVAVYSSIARNGIRGALDCFLAYHSTSSAQG